MFPALSVDGGAVLERAMGVLVLLVSYSNLGGGESCWRRSPGEVINDLTVKLAGGGVVGAFLRVSHV